jgi:lactoylglutathione lyase
MQLGYTIVYTPDAKALAAGAREMKAPERMPWGQTVSWLRCPDGLLVELCTPMG